jgi:hypothetical protein
VKCALCGRGMGQPAVTIGTMPVGPKCARRAGLMPLAAKQTGAVRPGPAYRRSATRQEVDQMELFEGVV